MIPMMECLNCRRTEVINIEEAQVGSPKAHTKAQEHPAAPRSNQVADATSPLTRPKEK